MGDQDQVIRDRSKGLAISLGVRGSQDPNPALPMRIALFQSQDAQTGFLRVVVHSLSEDPAALESPSEGTCKELPGTGTAGLIGHSDTTGAFLHRLCPADRL
jgi:hypothetical protein